MPPINLDYRTIDLAMFVLANLINLLHAGMFLARVKGWRTLAGLTGWSSVALGLPVAGIAALNYLAGREWWLVVLPALYVAFALLELLLDGILKIEFRNTRLLGPYLLVYYVSLWALVGYCFSTGAAQGFVTLTTYFVCLAVTMYAYRRVGHGVAGQPEENRIA